MLKTLLNDLKNGTSHCVDFLKKDSVEETISLAGIKVRKIFAPFLRAAYRTQTEYKIVIDHREKLKRSKNGKIFVINHRQGDDIVIGANVVNRSAYFVFGNQYLSLDTSNGLGLWAYGMILLNRGVKVNRWATYQKMKYVIEHGGNIIIYPEGYWNLDDNGEADERHSADAHNSENWLIQDFNIGAFRLHPLFVRIVPIIRNYKLEPFRCHEIPNGQVIFAANHSNIHDIPTVWEIVKKHAFTLAGDEPRGDFNGIALAVNGVIWVKRAYKESRQDAKKNMQMLLEKGKNLLVFPEATWNLTSEKPMLPLHWGIIELAQKAGCPIVPITLEYEGKKICRYSIGQAIYVSETDDKAVMIAKLRDEMSTMRWEAWEEFAQSKREDVSIEDYYEYTKVRLEEYPKLDVEFEKTTILQK